MILWLLQVNSFSENNVSYFLTMINVQTSTAQFGGWLLKKWKSHFMYVMTAHYEVNSMCLVRATCSGSINKWMREKLRAVTLWFKQNIWEPQHDIKSLYWVHLVFLLDNNKVKMTLWVILVLTLSCISVTKVSPNNLMWFPHNLLYALKAHTSSNIRTLFWYIEISARR